MGAKDRNGFRCSLKTARRSPLHSPLPPAPSPAAPYHPYCYQESVQGNLSVSYHAPQSSPSLYPKHVSVFRCSLQHFPSPGIQDMTPVLKGLAWGELPPLAGPPGWSAGTGSCIACVCTGLWDQPGGLARTPGLSEVGALPTPR